MKQKSLIIILVWFLANFFIKGIKHGENFEDVLEKQFNISKLEEQSIERENLFYDEDINKSMEEMKKELNEINLENIIKRIDRKKVQILCEDEKKNYEFNDLLLFKSYELLCLKKLSISTNIQSRLKCKYIDRGIPFLKIAPFKVEEAYLEPRIVLFHDILYEEEIETIKRLSVPKMEKATFYDEKSGEFKVEGYRITSTAWLEAFEHKDIETVYRRVELMTGLTLETAESLQVAYYPVRGKYEPHFDMNTDFPQSTDYVPNSFDRIATLLFYLSNVNEGGDTVFPKLDVVLKPRKGSAAFWYNFKANGFRDYLTIHAACPVISGSKWAANWWISTAWQEFYRPCTLDYQPRDEEWENMYSSAY